MSSFSKRICKQITSGEGIDGRGEYESSTIIDGQNSRDIVMVVIIVVAIGLGLSLNPVLNMNEFFNAAGQLESACGTVSVNFASFIKKPLEKRVLKVSFGDDKSLKASSIFL